MLTITLFFSFTTLKNCPLKSVNILSSKSGNYQWREKNKEHNARVSSLWGGWGVGVNCDLKFEEINFTKGKPSEKKNQGSTVARTHQPRLERRAK
jgi:hypothetical protein